MYDLRVIQLYIKKIHFFIRRLHILLYQILYVKATESPLAFSETGLPRYIFIYS